MTVLVESGPDAGVAWHAGDPLREQRRLERGEGAVDLSHRGIVAVTGPDRLSWLHSLTTQHLTGLAAGAATTADANGRSVDSTPMPSSIASASFFVRFISEATSQ